jgi:hypothetical protein
MVLEELRQRRQTILDAAARRGADQVRVFGSVARGEETDKSDVDLLVRFAAGRSLLDQVHLIEDLRELLEWTSMWSPRAVCLSVTATFSLKRCHSEQGR